MKLTQSQIDAIHYGNSNLQLIACAGSGKTEVIAQRVANLLKTGLLPKNIIAFTFTEKAAAELKERIVLRCRQELGEIHGMAEMFVGTVHGFCLDLLTAEVPKFLKFDVLNEVQQALFIDRHSNKSGLTASTDLSGQPLKRYRDTGHYLNALGILREADTDDKELINCSIVPGLDQYRQLLDETRHFDYSSIIEQAVEVLTLDAALRQRLQDRVKQLIVDEYQDLNPIQEAIVWLLHDLGAKVCVVGDDDQTIYQWRGSSVQGILAFAKNYPSVTTVKLEENFRSSEGIVETARPFIEQNLVRLPKKMQPTDAQKYEEGDIIALSFTHPDQEAEHIARNIQALRGLAIKDPTLEDKDHMRGISWSDMAILLRSVRANGAAITRALDIAGIPYVVAGMNNLFGTPEAEAARQLFYFMASRPTPDEISLANAWQTANLGIDSAALDRAIQAAKHLRIEFNASNLRNVRYGLQRVFIEFLDKCEIREEHVAAGQGEIAFYNLGKFTQVITDFETIHYHSKPVDLYSSFASFLEFQAEDAYPEGWQDNQYANPDAVRIMTIHQAKGMQWPVVFIPALLKNRFPSKKQGGRNVWHLLPRTAIENQSRYEGTVEDERRLFYVYERRSENRPQSAA